MLGRLVRGCLVALIVGTAATGGTVGAVMPLATASAAVSTAGPGAGTPGGTHFLNQDAYLSGLSDAQWYRDNIPFVDLPDQTIQSVYYYRWRTWKEHLRYTDTSNGWISTEFLDCCGYAAPYQAIDAAAGHQITEGRWIRDATYDNDYVKFWLTGPGAGPKPQTDSVNADTGDWAHEYSFWLASAAYGQAQVTGDFGPLERMLPDLIRQYRGWDNQYSSTLGLYWSVPVWDAMEFSVSSYESSDPYHGGAGYRPTLNAYQYGDAVAISHIAQLDGDTALAEEYASRARDLKAAMQKWLWDPTRSFYYSMARDENPDHKLLDTREEIGFVPWQFDAASSADSGAWAQLLDPNGFASAYGPTTAERRSPLFMHDAGGCCRWDGPSWPFATSQTLTGLANLLIENPTQTAITAGDYTAALHTFAETQNRNGVPYLAEAHSPDVNTWIYDGYNHSEDYNHSTFNDLVLSGLLGFRPRSDTSIDLHPLVPASWDHYLAENVPYHGHNITVIWDKDGSHYHQGSGLRIYLDGALRTSRSSLAPLTIDVGPTAAPPSNDGAGRVVNDAANPLRTGYPQPISSYTWQYDSGWNALDGKIWFNEVPEDTRWTNYSSPNAQDYYGVDFGIPTTVSDIRWYGYDDGGGVRPAADYRLQYWTGTTWSDVPGQQRNTATPVGNGLNRITFPPLDTTKVRLLFTNSPGAYVGVTEFQSWSVSSDALSLGIGSAPPALVDGPTQVPIILTNTTDHAVRSVAVKLSVPTGWRASTAATVNAVAPGKSTEISVTLTPPADISGGTTTTVRATASYLGRGGVELRSHAMHTVRTAYPNGPTEPVGSWNLEEGSGAIAHDTSGAGNDATISGAPAWAAGHNGADGALQLNGIDQFAQTTAPVLDTVGNFSVAAWVRLDSTDNWATAVSQDGTTTSGFFLQYSAADGRLAFSTGEGRALADAAPKPGQWYHLVGVHDANAGTYKLYVDGVAQAKTLDQAQGDTANGPFAIGRARSSAHDSDFFPGAIQHVHAWDRALTASDVATLYASGS